MKKVKKNFWEKAFTYPSFKRRFSVTLLISVVLFGLAVYVFLFKLGLAETVADKVSMINLLVQSATLLLGIIAAYYALRQLIETRFTSLDEAGMQEYKRQHYFRAFTKWKEALYIRPEVATFNNMAEALLLMGDFDMFDDYIIRMSESNNFFGGDISETEISDRATLLFLRATRNLLVKNQGEAEKYIKEIIALAKEDDLRGLNWDFVDLQRSRPYQDLSGECKIMIDNLIYYLQKTLLPLRVADFELGNFATQAVEPPTPTIPVVIESIT